MLFSPQTLIIPVFFVWLTFLTFVVLRFYLYHLKIIKGGKKESLIAIIENVLDDHKHIQKRLDDINKKCDKLESEGLLHIQKIGLLRFNPFKDTGGDQSFILTLLDAQDTGVVISSLHTRTGTRWYAKRVVKGRGLEYDLSEDEQKALKESKFLKKN